jgi:hypothetical protein
MPSPSRRRRSLAAGVCIVGCLVAGAGLAQAAGPARSSVVVPAQVTPPPTPEAFIAVAPQRVLDTRGPSNGPIGVAAAGPLRGGQEIDLPLTTPAPNRPSAPLPANATAALVNITIDDDAAAKSFLTVWPTGTPRPFTSANNAEPGLVSPNLNLAKLGPTGSISFYAQQGAINIAVDLVGYTVPLSTAAAGTGAPLLTGAGAPAATLGADGDIYLDVTTGQLYGPKAGGTWPAPLPTPPPAAISEGDDDVALTLSVDALPAFGADVTVWTLTGLPSTGDHVLDATVTLLPTAALTDDAAVQCWWSTRPDRVFTTHLTAAAIGEELLHAETLSVVGSVEASATAALVCHAASASPIADAIAVTAVQVNAGGVALVTNS